MNKTRRDILYVALLGMVFSGALSVLSDSVISSFEAVGIAIGFGLLGMGIGLGLDRLFRQVRWLYTGIAFISFSLAMLVMFALSDLPLPVLAISLLAGFVIGGLFGWIGLKYHLLGVLFPVGALIPILLAYRSGWTGLFLSFETLLGAGIIGIVIFLLFSLTAPEEELALAGWFGAFGIGLFLVWVMPVQGLFALQAAEITIFTWVLIIGLSIVLLFLGSPKINSYWLKLNLVPHAHAVRFKRYMHQRLAELKPENMDAFERLYLDADATLRALLITHAAVRRYSAAYALFILKPNSRVGHHLFEQLPYLYRDADAEARTALHTIFIAGVKSPHVDIWHLSLKKLMGMNTAVAAEVSCEQIHAGSLKQIRYYLSNAAGTAYQQGVNALATIFPKLRDRQRADVAMLFLSELRQKDKGKSAQVLVNLRKKSPVAKKVFAVLQDQYRSGRSRRVADHLQTLAQIDPEYVSAQAAWLLQNGSAEHFSAVLSLDEKHVLDLLSLLISLAEDTHLPKERSEYVCAMFGRQLQTGTIPVKVALLLTMSLLSPSGTLQYLQAKGKDLDVAVQRQALGIPDGNLREIYWHWLLASADAGTTDAIAVLEEIAR